MKKLISLFILLSVMSCSAVASSQSVERADPGFVLLDVLLYRPMGLVVTIVGTGVFLGVSPLIALASIPEPHDAFAKTSNILILLPAAYTFVRPIGDREFPYYASPYKHKPVATQNNAVIPKQSPVTPAVPQVQSPSPQRYPDTGKGL
jgi:hypothetical protein